MRPGRAALSLRPERSLAPQLPALHEAARPSEADCARWRARAEAHLERCIADFDAALLAGEGVELAAFYAVDEWMSWVRRSLTELVTPQGQEIVRGELRQNFSLAWRLAADEVVAQAADEPAALERFCHRYLDVATTRCREGYAALFSLAA